jgi:hypothetical protein
MNKSPHQYNFNFSYENNFDFKGRMKLAWQILIAFGEPVFMLRFILITFCFNPLSKINQVEICFANVIDIFRI